MADTNIYFSYRDKNSEVQHGRATPEEAGKIIGHLMTYKNKTKSLIDELNEIDKDGKG